MPVFIFVGKVVLLICIKSALIMSLPARTINKTSLKATFHLTISIRGQRATGKIQKNNYHHGSYGPSLTGKTSSVSLIFAHGTHWECQKFFSEKCL